MQQHNRAGRAGLGGLAAQGFGKANRVKRLKEPGPQNQPRALSFDPGHLERIKVHPVTVEIRSVTLQPHPAEQFMPERAIPQECPFRVLKRQVGHVKTRYRGLAKNRAQLFTLFALGNLFLVRRKLRV